MLPRRDRGQPSVVAKLLSIQDVLRIQLNIPIAIFAYSKGNPLTPIEGAPWMTEAFKDIEDKKKKGKVFDQ